MTDFLARMRGHYASGRPWSFGWHLTSTGSLASVAAEWDTALQAMWTDGATGLQALIPTTTVWDDSIVVQLTPALTFSTESAPVVRSEAGTNANTGMPDEVAMVWSLRSTDISKSGRGRSKLPAPAENEGTNGQLGSAPATTLGGAGRLLLSTLNGAGITVFVFNRQVTISRPVAKTKTTITGVLGSAKLGTVAERAEKTIPVYH